MEKWSFIETRSDMKLYLYSQVSRTRFSKDGRKCAASFAVNGVIHKDCTSGKSPDSKNTKQEWCYIDPREGGTPNWGYCVAVLDFDKVRKKSQEIMIEYIPEIRKASDLVQQQIQPTAKINTDMTSIEKIQNVLDVQTNIAEKKIDLMDQQYQQLMKMRKQWEDWEKEIEKLKMDIAELEKTNIEDSPNNCEGMLCYEQENDGDGVLGEYWNNEDFQGEQQTKEETEGLVFDWSGQAPMRGIYPDNFSIKWTTYLKIPISTNYYFKLITNDGSMLLLNNKLIISHFIGSTDGPKDIQKILQVTETENSKKSHLLTNVNNYEEGKFQLTSRKQDSMSESVYLVSGSKYKISILYFHSVHNKYREDGNNFLKVHWKSDYLYERIIDQDYLYLTPKQPPLKLWGYESSYMIMHTFRDYDDAFINSDIFKMADIPQQFQGLQQMRMPQIYLEKSIKLYSNNPVIIYMASNMKEPNPFPDDFKEVGEVMSILKISKYSLPDGNKVRAIQSYPFKIYAKSFPKGEIEINFIEGEKQTLLSLIFFFQLDPIAAEPLSCGGVERDISKNDGEAFDKCKASSVKEGGEHNCEYAFTGQLIDQPFKIWATDGEGIGSWIEIYFKQMYQITKILYKNRDKSVEKNRELIVAFSNGFKMMAKLKNTDTVQTINLFEPIVAQSIKFTVKAVYTQFNNGGSFKIMGLPCINPNEKPEIEVEEDENEVMELQCKDTMINNMKILKKNYEEGDSFKVKCIEECSEKKEFKVYGSLMYSEESSICKASAHMGINIKKDIEFKVLVDKFQSSYESAVKNNIQSEGKEVESGKLSITFEGVKDVDQEVLDNVFVGMKVDLFDSKTKQWLMASVSELDRKSQNILFIKVSREGFGSEFDQKVQFPSEGLIDYCGKQISTRDDCDEKSKDPANEDKNTIKICFTVNEDCGVKGYLVDAGAKKQKHKESGMVYGWDRDNSGMLRQRGVSQDKILDNMILFPADMKSQWCLENSKVPCLPSTWSIDVPNGKYDVMVTAGDPAFSVGYSINVNNNILINGQILKRNEYFTKPITVLVNSGNIKIDGVCKAKDCKNVWSRINSVVITKNTKPGEIKEEPGDGRLGCGVAYGGEKCANGKQVENCIFETVSEKGVHNCSSKFKLVHIPSYYECKDQRGKYKCIKTAFKDNDECRKYCPGKCKKEVCQIKPGE